MSKFQYVVLCPATGFPDRLWDLAEGADPVKDAFVRSARGATELYSEALRTLDVQGYKSMLRLGCGHHPGRGSDDVEVVVESSKPYDVPGEMGAVRIPTVVGRLDAGTRARLALDAVHTAVLLLAEIRGWEPLQFERCHRHVVDNDFEYRWQSAWKSSPDRRHEARAAFRLPPDDGYGRVRLEVRARGSEEPPAAGGEAIAFSTAKGLERSAGTLRWRGAGEVTLTPYCGLGPAHYSGQARASLRNGTWDFEHRDEVRVRRPGGEGVGAADGEVVSVPAVLRASQSRPSSSSAAMPRVTKSP